MNFFEKFISEIVEKGIHYDVDKKLSGYSSFKIGGNCKLIIEPKNIRETAFCIKKLNEYNLPKYIIGKGSNMLFSDEGYDGIIIRLGNEFSTITLIDENTLKCEAGAPLSKVCEFALKNSLSGMEFAWGIPGTVGGAAYMNAGAYNGEMANVIVKCSHLDAEGNRGEFDSNSLEFSYRHSIYENSPYCITEVFLKLVRDDKNKIKEKMDDYINKRKSKQPLEYPSAGSTFKRPEGNYASALIEQCGLKGMCVGGAQVSEKHSGFVINRGNASCKDVLTLIEEIKKIVYNKTGYMLECEIKRL